MIDFFSKDENDNCNYTTFEIKMLKEDESPEVAEDNGGILRDALTEFWESFYLQFTEGNVYKVPVFRHDIGEDRWTAVGAIIKIGYEQEGVFQIKLAKPFMQQAIFKSCSKGELVDSFLKIVPEMDKNVLQDALKDFASVDKDDLFEFMEQHNVKKVIKADNVAPIVEEVAHKELVQTPTFVDECFNMVLHDIKTRQDDLSGLYVKLQPNTKKVLKSLVFPEDMNQEETILSSHVRKLIREMDGPDYLGLFLRFCKGSDVMTNKNINVSFTCNDASENMRCPSSHTCGQVLEIPRSYTKDPYIMLKADFTEFLKNRYWQMDIV